MGYEQIYHVEREPGTQIRIPEILETETDYSDEKNRLIVRGNDIVEMMFTKGILDIQNPKIRFTKIN